MPRVKRVTRAQKDQGVCGKCGVEINKGDGYVWWPPYFRSRSKAKRCTKSTCYPRPSELDSSKKSTILAAQEAFEDSIDNLTTESEIEEAVHTVAEAVTEVAGEYREALDMWPNGNSQLEEQADHYESVASELESFSLSVSIEEADEPEEPEAPADDADEEAQDAYQGEYNDYVNELAYYEQCEQSLEDARDEAREAVDGIDFL